MTPCPHCDQASVIEDGCCIHCGADRSDELDHDYTDPTFVLGAVLAQIEDLTDSDKDDVLTQALNVVRDSWKVKGGPDGVHD